MATHTNQTSLETKNWNCYSGARLHLRINYVPGSFQLRNSCFGGPVYWGA